MNNPLPDKHPLKIKLIEDDLDMDSDADIGNQGKRPHFL